MSRDNPRAVKITEALTQHIALDDQPFSVVDNVGFRRLLSILEPRYDIPSRHHITDKALPKLRNFVKNHISNLLQDISAFSFTTDIWTSSVSPLSLISLTAQWINEDFTSRRAVLHTKQLRGSLTNVAIASIFDDMLQSWGIPKSAVHVVLQDNAKNMVKAMTEAGLPSLPCVAHTLQLAVNKGLLAQRSVADAVAVGRRIVGHFKHSALACSRLEDIQVELDQPIKRLQQDIMTRWNSTFYMLQSLIEQKRTLGIFASEQELPHLWALLEKTHLFWPLLKNVTVLLRLLTKEMDEEHGIKTMKATLAAAIKRRFSDTEKNPLYCIATVLDPR